MNRARGLSARIALACASAALLGCSADESPYGKCRAAAPAEPVPLAEDFGIDDCRGKVVVLNFWATWCGPCRMEIPALVKLRKVFPDDQIAIIGISTGEIVSGKQLQTSLKTFISEHGINYPIYHDADGGAYRHYSEEHRFRQAIPATLVFDREGNVRATYRGVPNDASGWPNPYAVLGEQIQFLLENP